MDLIFKNILGFFCFLFGVIQSFLRLIPRDSRPDVVFLKGGFVGLPVGIAARIFRIPYVVHESDVVPGLANRMLMRKARVVAMGMPFNKEKGKKNWEWVGIPVSSDFRMVNEKRVKSLKKTLGFDENKPLVMVTGGSQGAENINEAMRKILPEMLKFTSVGLVAGRKHYENMVDLKKYETWDKAKLTSNFRLWEFSSVMNELLGAADVVVSRAGATTISELAILKKAVILVPFERLPGGHQAKNAERLVEVGAVVSVNDSEMNNDPNALLKEVKRLVKNSKTREKLAKNLHKEAKNDASRRLAEILIEVGA